MPTFFDTMMILLSFVTGCLFTKGMISLSYARKREKELADKKYRDPLTGLPLRMNDSLIRLRLMAKNGVMVEEPYDRRPLASATSLGLIRYDSRDGRVYVGWDLRKENELRMRTEASDELG